VQLVVAVKPVTVNLAGGPPGVAVAVTVATPPVVPRLLQTRLTVTAVALPVGE
jgi:hypothetical protein